MATNCQIAYINPETILLNNIILMLKTKNPIQTFTGRIIPYQIPRTCINRENLTFNRVIYFLTKF